MQMETHLNAPENGERVGSKIVKDFYNAHNLEIGQRLTQEQASHLNSALLGEKATCVCNACVS